MSRRNLAGALVLVVVGLALTGCMPHMTIEQMKEKMPKRPADQLNAFVGQWKSEGEANFAMLDKPVKFTGTEQSEWGGDRWYLVGRGTMTMEHFGETQEMEIWTYDVHDKKFRTAWVDSMGMMETGESTYSEKDKTWYMSAASHGPWGKAYMKGTVRFTDPNTMEWSIEEWEGLMKTMTMKCTSKRVK